MAMPLMDRLQNRKNEVAEATMADKLAAERAPDAGTYSAEGDPYTYEVLADGQITISKDGEVLDTVSNASGMGRAITKQIAEGQLSVGTEGPEATVEAGPAEFRDRAEETPYAEDRMAGFSDQAAGKPTSVRDRIDDGEAAVEAEEEPEPEDGPRGLTPDKTLAAAKKAMGKEDEDKDEDEDEDEDKDKDKDKDKDEGDEPELTLAMLKGGE